MLNIYKNEALTTASISQANVRQRELDYYTTNYWTWCSTATATCLACNLCVITWTAFLCIWGPGLALRGRKGMLSFHDSIDFMQSEQKTIYWVFNAGVVGFFASSCTLVWVYPSRDRVNAACMVILGAFLLVVIVIQGILGRRLKHTHLAGHSDTTDGRIIAFDQFMHVGDLDYAATEAHDDQVGFLTGHPSRTGRASRTSRASNYGGTGAFSW
eukprot:GEMP01093341.1.p1 GENE.GEMP01093341.1~~GEMP01093341.1.p1  ORF type:complete len:214 (+),score=34.02 GEMP01093341.1:155-796(+)